MATRPACSRAASWSGRAMTRSRSASSRRTSIRITTRSPRSGAGFSRRSRGCSSRCWRWRARWACSRWARDGTKIHANASRHSALSYEHAGKIGAQLKAEVAELLARAEAADHADVPDGMSIPDELARREKRLAKLAQARAKIEARAKERFEREAAEHKAKLAAREAKAKATGNKPTGKPPQPPVEGARPTDQINLTDEASRIMPVAGGGFEQCYNAQAVVAADSLLVIAAHVVQAPNDKQQIEPMLERIGTLPEEAGDVAGGGVMPSRPTLTRLASSVPSSFLTAPKMMTLAPAFSSDLSPATKVTIGVPGGTTTFFSPSLYLTRTVCPSVPLTVCATVALVMVEFGR